MKLRDFISIALTATMSLLGPQSVALAAEFALPSSGSMVDPGQVQSAEPTSRNIRVSPEALKQLSPEQQQIIRKRLQNENGKTPSSSETKILSPGESFGNAEKADESKPSQQSESNQSQELSDFERAFLDAAGLPGGLRQYGYNLFTGAPSTFAPADDIPVSDDYVITAGDEIIVSMVSPRRNGDYSLTVNRNGTISLPNIGTLPVAGMNFSRLTSFLTQKIKGGAPDMRLSIRMGKLRSIKVFVVGRVRRPGAYTISSLSNLSNALMACGGPTKMGSLRNVQLKRNGRTIVLFDLYDFLMKGDNSKDLRLQSGDILFVPEIGPVIGIAGNVREPAIYELKGKTSLLQALKLAGDITPMGYTQQVQIERFHENEAKMTIDIDLSKMKNKGKIALQDGDLVKVSSITPKLLNTVYLEGHVLRPGKYEYRPNLKIRDIIKDENDLKPEFYQDFALIERVMPPDAHIELIPFNLKRALAGNAAENKFLSPGDTIRIYYRWAVQEQPKVRIAGVAQKAGEFQLRPNMTIAELIHLAGGLRDEADLKDAELTRVQVVDNKMKSLHLTINLERALRGEKSDNLILMRDDHLLIKPVPEYKLYRTITLGGEVAQPGTYTFQDGETLSDLIKRAGGLTKRAYPKAAIFSRLSVKQMQEEHLQDLAKKLEADLYRSSSQRIASAITPEAAQANEQALTTKKALLDSIKQTKSSGRVIVDVARLLSGPHTMADIQLEEGDMLIVPQVVTAVSVLGQVYNPTAITYESGRNVDYYLSKTGNPTEYADTNGIYVIKADGSILTDKNFKTGWLFWRRGVRSATLEPGDTVMVPERMVDSTNLRDLKDITQVLFQIATTAGITWGMIRK